MTKQLYTVKAYSIDSNKLINLLCHVINMYKDRKKCLYTKWLAKDLGMPKLALEMFVLQHSHIFEVEVGEKSNNLIIKGIKQSKLLFNSIYTVQDASGLKDIFVKPLFFVEDSNNEKVICKKWSEGESYHWYEEESVALLTNNR